MIYLKIGVFLKDYEIEIERLGQQNQRYLEVFEAELKAANLKAKTIEKHLDNTEFYINTYLMNRLVQEMKDGVVMNSMHISEIISFVKPTGPHQRPLKPMPLVLRNSTKPC